MQTEQRPAGVLEFIKLAAERGGQLAAADEIFECLMHVERAGHEKTRPHRCAVAQNDAACPATLEEDAFDIDLRRIGAARADETLH
jgi:hypothetical protein